MANVFFATRPRLAREIFHETFVKFAIISTYKLLKSHKIPVKMQDREATHC
jgi:hypothetical protein